jgi:hypothetical protein
MTSNNVDWEKGWSYLCNDGAGLPPYTGKVMMGKTDAWHHGVSPPRGNGGWSLSPPHYDSWQTPD